MASPFGHDHFRLDAGDSHERLDVLLPDSYAFLFAAYRIDKQHDLSRPVRQT